MAAAGPFDFGGAHHLNLLRFRPYSPRIGSSPNCLPVRTGIETLFTGRRGPAFIPTELAMSRSFCDIDVEPASTRRLLVFATHEMFHLIHLNEFDSAETHGKDISVPEGLSCSGEQ